MIFMHAKHDAPGMKGERARTEHGELRRKRGDTRMETIEHQYGRDFGVRGDMHLQTYLDQNGFDSLSELLKSKHGR